VVVPEADRTKHAQQQAVCQAESRVDPAIAPAVLCQSVPAARSLTRSAVSSARFAVMNGAFSQPQDRPPTLVRISNEFVTSLLA
jgi:hypothetical protein